MKENCWQQEGQKKNFHLQKIEVVFQCQKIKVVFDFQKKLRPDYYPVLFQNTDFFLLKTLSKPMTLAHFWENLFKFSKIKRWILSEIALLDNILLTFMLYHAQPSSPCPHPSTNLNKTPIIQVNHCFLKFVPWGGIKEPWDQVATVTTLAIKIT